MLAFPWATTPIGPIDGWPEQLRLLVEVMLSSEFPMMIVGGTEYTQLYNDGFRPILGTGKHPGALGRSARETWAEIWDEIGPLFAKVFAGEAVWNADHRLLINRNGYDEEAFFTYSYSPIHDGSGSVAGLLVVATETTTQVVDGRRLSCVGSLARALVGATSIESVTNVTIDALRDCVPATAIAIHMVLTDSVVRIASLPGHRTETTTTPLFARRRTLPVRLCWTRRGNRDAPHLEWHSRSTTRSCGPWSPSRPIAIARSTTSTSSSSISSGWPCRHP